MTSLVVSEVQHHQHLSTLPETNGRWYSAIDRSSFRLVECKSDDAIEFRIEQESSAPQRMQLAKAITAAILSIFKGHPCSSTLETRTFQCIDTMKQFKKRRLIATPFMISWLSSFKAFQHCHFRNLPFWVHFGTPWMPMDRRSGSAAVRCFSILKFLGLRVCQKYRTGLCGSSWKRKIERASPEKVTATHVRMTWSHVVGSFQSMEGPANFQLLWSMPWAPPIGLITSINTSLL